jgi:hypothetical protein
VSGEHKGRLPRPSASINPFPGVNDAVSLAFVNPPGQLSWGTNWSAFFGTGNTGLPTARSGSAAEQLPGGATFCPDLASSGEQPAARSGHTTRSTHPGRHQRRLFQSDLSHLRLSDADAKRSRRARPRRRDRPSPRQISVRHADDHTHSDADDDADDHASAVPT